MLQSYNNLELMKTMLYMNSWKCLQESEHGRTPSAGVQSRLMSMRVYYGRDKFLHFAPCLTREKPNGDLVFGNDV